jgi:hypothetical protein
MRGRLKIRKRAHVERSRTARFEWSCDPLRTFIVSSCNRPLTRCSGHSLPVRGVGSVVAPDRNPLHSGSRHACPARSGRILDRECAGFPVPTQQQLLLANGLLQCTLGFARLPRTDAKHSLRNGLVRIYLQVAGYASRSRDLRNMHRYHDCAPQFGAGMRARRHMGHAGVSNDALNDD